MLRISFLLLLFGFTLNAQTLFSTFKPLIDPSLINEDNKIEDVSLKLEYVSQYNPEFLYYYLQYLKLLSVDPLSAKTANAYLIYKQNDFCRYLGVWIEKQRGIVDEQSISFAQSYRINGYLDDLERNHAESWKAVEPGYDIEANYMNYIVYLFYKRSFSEYDAAVNYKLKVNEISSAVIKELDYAYSNADKLSADKLEFYFEAGKQYPFMFKETINETITDPLNVYLAEFLIKISSAQYKQVSTVSGGVGVELFNLPKDRISSFNDENFVLETSLKNTSRLSYSAGLGFSIKLREYKSMFSSVNIGLTIGYSSGSKSDYTYEPKNEGRPYYIIYYQNTGTRVDPNYKIDGAYNYSSTSYAFKASTPLLYLFSNFSIDAGVLVHYLKHSDNAFISRHDKFFRNGMNLSEDLLVNYDKNTEIINSSTTIYPMFAVNYFITGYLNFRTTIYGLNAPQFELLYNYSL